MDKFDLIKNFFSTVHYLYLKYKHVSFTLFFLLLIFAIFSSSTVALGEKVIGAVPTQVKVTYDGKTKSFVATQNTVRGALEQGGISLQEYDIAAPSLDALVNGGKIEVAVTRALPVLISDNNQERLAYSAYTNETDILKQLGIEYFPEDKISSNLILDPADENAVGQKIKIERAPVYIIEVDGAEKVARSWLADPLEVIEGTDITLGPQDIIEPGAGKTLSLGQRIIITRINEFDETATEVVPYETVYQGSYNLPFGESQVTQAGVNGTVQKTYHVVYKNGVEVSRSVISSSVIVPKKNKIVSSGIIKGRANFGYYDGMVTSFYKGMTGRYLIVTNLANGKQVKVRIIGSGPFNGPLLDMGTEPFQAIGGTLSGGYIPAVSVQLVE